MSKPAKPTLETRYALLIVRTTYDVAECLAEILWPAGPVAVVTEIDPATPDFDDESPTMPDRPAGPKAGGSWC